MFAMKLRSVSSCAASELVRRRPAVIRRRDSAAIGHAKTRKLVANVLALVELDVPSSVVLANRDAQHERCWAKIAQPEVTQELVNQAQRQRITGATKCAIVDVERQQHEVSVCWDRRTGWRHCG